jgi:hypothetical protein
VIRSASLGVCPVTGLRATSLTEKIPNCLALPSLSQALTGVRTKTGMTLVVLVWYSA